MESLKESIDMYDTDNLSASIEKEIKNEEEFSNDSDGFCGEALCAQRVRLDFTPDEEIDNDYVQNKCCAFWNFIYSVPEIQNLVVKPEKNVEFQRSDSTYAASMSGTEKKTDIGSKDLGRTALSMLEFAENKGLIDRTFEAKIHESHCTMGSREYKEQEIPPKKPQRGICVHCKQAYWCNFYGPCPCEPPPEPTPLKKLVRGMQAWDQKHPKSMEEPGHAPSLQHSVLQRKPGSTNLSDSSL